MNGKHSFYGLHAKVKYSFKYFFYIRKNNVFFSSIKQIFLLYLKEIFSPKHEIHTSDKRKRQVGTLIREKLIRQGKVKRCHLPGQKRT